METYRTLEKALGELTPENWHNGDALFGGPPGSCALCLGGRISAALPGASYWRPGAQAVKAVEKEIMARGCPRVTHPDVGPGAIVSQFNGGATFEEVTSILKRAIRAEKAKAGTPFDLPTEVAEGERVNA